ncbi:hypothetical protein I312_105488 [Cryptococcus bacillisporus CA1280]|uniref:Hepatocyte nuclear factor n=1 Tax=Cryptococcus bacillisporus CA1280 TaxID=1296109 RepID=A0A0D0VNH2_CRYGA|nr:hepatocyte nuclear factor [Cryptococcus bacillisporus CA1280]
MSRPTSSDSQHSGSMSSHSVLQNEIVHENNFMTTPTSASYQTQVYYADPYAHASFQHYQGSAYGGEVREHMITPYGGHQVAQGRIAMPMHGQPLHRSPNGAYEEFEFTPFVPEEETTPYLQVPERYHPMVQSPSMTMGQFSHPLSPVDQMTMEHHRFQRSNSLGNQPQQFIVQTGRPQRPKLQTSQSMIGPTRPSIQNSMQRIGMTRHASLRGTTRPGSPYVAGDVFDHVPGQLEESPVYQPIHPQDPSWELSAFEPHYANGQGISPARALGPAPTQPQRFSPRHDELMVTPQANKIAYSGHPPSSAISTAASTSSNFSVTMKHQRREFDSSDDEQEGRTRKALPPRTVKTRQEEKLPPPPLPLPTRPPPKSASARAPIKPVKVAEDPGVEGIPPGPRSHERPGPSFACIIGQAILSCKAGGLSLEHIYRYVETAYPYFKSGDNAWRNSVRHNLSIHKMFETIPRTEKFPPGKGGIWIIHEDEKCHWPAQDKFIKNFPPGHPHHNVCRQTLHERQKEKDAMEKAAREGRVYIPKKGKKRRKQMLKEELEAEMAKRLAIEHPGAVLSEQKVEEEKEQTPEPVEQEIASEEPVVNEPEARTAPEPEPTAEVEIAPKPEPKKNTPMPPPAVKLEKWALPPPPVDPKGKRKQTESEDDPLFSNSKRVRLAEPLAPIHPFPQESVPGKAEKYDASFVTPERERPIPNGSKLLSSASDFKTPALVQSSSSPGSPPMPTTVTRPTHHPSSLQQAWTHDDMSQTPPRDSSPARPMLDAAFDLKPKSLRTKQVTQEDGFPHSHTDLASPPHPRGPPKTPVTRSSAAADKTQTPRLHHRKTPSMSAVTPVVFRDSPGLPPPSSSALLSTPMWEIGGCLDRLKDHFAPSPTSSIRPIRSPAPPTSPTRYAMMLMETGGSPRKGKSAS